MLNKSNFICKQCGKCCKAYTVKLSGSDIERIKKAGYKKEDFAEKDDFDVTTGKYALKRENNQCMFLIQVDDKYFCQIYENRPEICRKYPFFEKEDIESCEPSIKK